MLSTMVPFVHGGAEELFNHLIRNLQLTGVEAEGFRIPFTWNPAERLIEEMLIARRLRLWNFDRLIALKFPVYLVPWPNKVVWLLHQHRQAYDLLDAGQSNIPSGSRGVQLVDAIRTADNIGFAEARQIFTSSPTTSRRLSHYNGFDSTVLRPPLNDPELFMGGEDDGYILATGRVNAGKRQYLLIHALRYAPNVKLVIAGPPDTPEDIKILRSIVEKEGVTDRVTLDLRFLTRSELAERVNRARAVAYLPYDEDSLGYCTREAFHAGKPVLTTSDSGGVLDIVKDKKTGLVSSPDAESLGLAMRILANDGNYSLNLGKAGRAALNHEELDWPSTISKLLS